MNPLGYVHRYEPPPQSAAPGTLLLLHGTGGNENDLLPVGRAIAPGAGLLAPRGPVLEHGMPRFFRRHAEGVLDHADLVARAHQLADWVLAAAERHRFDPRRVVAVGFSNGANIAAATLLLRPGLFAGAILLRPLMPFEPPEPPSLQGCRVLVAAGRVDTVAPAAQAERLTTLLRASGAEVTLHWSPVGHTLDRADLEAARRWWEERRESPADGPGAA